MKLENLLSELELKGIENDSEVLDRSHKQLNITKDTGEFLAILVKSSCAETILEVGTSNGYSTLWLAAATSESGKVTTLEVQQHKIDQAQVNFNNHFGKTDGWNLGRPGDPNYVPFVPTYNQIPMNDIDIA